MLGAIRSFYSLSIAAFSKLYTSHFRLRLEYGGPAVFPCTTTGLQYLEGVQRYATLLVDGFRGIHHKGQLRLLKLLAIGDSVEIYSLSGRSFSVIRGQNYNHCFRYATAIGRAATGLRSGRWNLWAFLWRVVSPDARLPCETPYRPLWWKRITRLGSNYVSASTW